MAMGETYVSLNVIKDAPQFTKWAEDNRERIGKAEKNGTLSYFLNENKSFLEKGGKTKQKRIRTSQEVEDIKARWAERQERNNFINEMKEFNWTDKEKTAIAKYWQDIEKKQGWKKGHPMTAEEADKQKANPHFFESRGYQINCQTCVPTYQLRTHGFNVVATPRTKNSDNDYLATEGRWAEIWKDCRGNDCKPILFSESTISGKKETRYSNAFRYPMSFYQEFIERNTKEPGLYQIAYWHAKGGHTTILERSKDGKLSYIEPQLYYDDATRHSVKEMIKSFSRCMQGDKNGILRIDNKLIKDKYLPLFSPGK